MKTIFLLIILIFKAIQSADESNSRLNLKDCGLNKMVANHKHGLEYFVVGGTNADIAKYPWIVSFQKYNRKNHLDHFCGGAILNNRWILTAAHCFHSIKHSIKKLRAVVGTTLWREGAKKGAVYEIEKAVTHESYDAFNYANDIALIKTKAPIKLKNDSKYYFVNSICMPFPGMNIGTSANVYGWGLMGELKGKSDTLLETTLIRFDSNKCGEIYAEHIGNLTEKMICFSALGKDACQGDSGGPLSQTINGREYQLGIVSFGNGCGKADYPGIYTNIALYDDWIEDTIEDN